MQVSQNEMNLESGRKHPLSTVPWLWEKVGKLRRFVPVERGVFSSQATAGISDHRTGQGVVRSKLFSAGAIHPRSFLEGDVDCNESLASEKGSLSRFPVQQLQLVAGSCAWHSLWSLSCARSPESALSLVSQDRGSVRGRGGWRLTLHRGSGHQAGPCHSMCCPHPGGRLWLFPSCAGCSLSTPMGSEVTSSIPSSVKPAFSSLTYFPAPQCWNNASLCSLFRPSFA